MSIPIAKRRFVGAKGCDLLKESVLAEVLAQEEEPVGNPLVPMVFGNRQRLVEHQQPQSPEVLGHESSGYP